MKNKRGQIPQAFVAFLAIALFVFALFQFNAYRNNLAKSAYNVAGIEDAFMKEEYFKSIIHDGLESISKENKDRKTLAGPPLEPRDATDSDEEFVKRKFKEFVDNEIRKREGSKHESALSQIKQLKAYLDSDKITFDFANDNLEMHVPEIVFDYGVEKFFDEEQGGREITLIYKKDFVFHDG